MYSKSLYINSIPNNQIIVLVLLLNLLFSCKSLYSDQHYQELENITIGNGLTFHPKDDLLLISKPTDKKSEEGKSLYKIFQLEFKNGKWCCEKEISFSSDFNDYHPVFSPDGKWVYFNSDKPIPNSTKQSEKMNIWRVKYNNGNWGVPEYLTAINTENHESYPTITNDGTLYFNSDREGGKGSMDIYKSELKQGNFSTPVPILALNSIESENDLVVDPNERFMIFNRYIFENKEIELFISFNKNGIWSEPKPVNTINKKNVWELTPTLSPDGIYFLYEIERRIKVQKLSAILNIKI